MSSPGLTRGRASRGGLRTVHSVELIVTQPVDTGKLLRNGIVQTLVSGPDWTPEQLSQRQIVAIVGRRSFEAGS
jgi:hypothetical protein